MPALTRRRSIDPHRETWNVSYGDVVVGHIGRRGGIPKTALQWSWSCGFYPGCDPGQHRSGVAANFGAARVGFEADWTWLLPQLSEAAFDECRRSRAFQAWKHRMWACGCRLPTQERSGRSRCFCGVDIAADTLDRHIFTAHMAGEEGHSRDYAW